MIAVKIREIWAKIMGKMIVEKTGEMVFYKGKLTIRVTSSPLRQELDLSKTKVMEMLNEELQGPFVKEIQFF